MIKKRIHGVPVVIVKLTGGLGNQLFQYAVGRTISVRRNIPLKLDVSTFETYKLRAYSLNHLNIVEEIASKEEIARFDEGGANASLNIVSKLGRRILPDRFRYTKVTEAGLPFDPEILKMRGNLYLDGYWQTEKYFKGIEDIIRREFTVKDKPGPLTEQISQAINDTDSVCIHIRRGDYVSNSLTNQLHGVCTLDYYQSAIEKLTQGVVAPHFFVFSDDPAWAKENLKTDHPTTFVTHNDASTNYDDLRLMSFCKHYIIANSSFSWWGAWLGAHPAKMVFAPRAWFHKAEHDTKDLIPDSWHLV